MMECANQETDETGTPSPTADKAQAFLDKVEQEDPILMKKVRRIYRVEPRKTPESEESPAE